MLTDFWASWLQTPSLYFTVGLDSAVSSLTPSDHRISPSRRSSLLQIWGWWRPVQRSRASPRQRCSLPEPKPPAPDPLSPSAPGPPLERWRSQSRWCFLRRERTKVRDSVEIQINKTPSGSNERTAPLKLHDGLQSLTENTFKCCCWFFSVGTWVL